MSVATYAECSASERAEAIEQLGALLSATTAELLDVVTAADRAGDWEVDGATGMAPWLVATLRVSSLTARQSVRAGERLDGLPAVREALGDGVLSWDQVRPATSFVDQATDEVLARELQGCSVAQVEALARQHRPRRTAEDEEAARVRRFRWRTDHIARGLQLHRVPADRGRGAGQPGHHPASPRQRRPGPRHRPVGAVRGPSRRRPRGTGPRSGSGSTPTPTPAWSWSTPTPTVIDGHRRRERDDRGPVDLAGDRPAAAVRLQDRVLHRRTRRHHHRHRPRRPQRRPAGSAAASPTATAPAASQAAAEPSATATTSNTGPTTAPPTPDNLAGLCWQHHHLVHEGGWTITGNADHELTFTSPTGRTLSSRAKPVQPQVRHRARAAAGLA